MVLLLVALLFTFNNAFAMDVPPSVVTVVSLNDQGKPDRQGLGVFIQENGRILTSAQFLGNKKSLVIQTHTGELLLTPKVLWLDHFSDLAVLEIEKGKYPAVKLSRTGVPPQAKVFTIVRNQERLVLKETVVQAVFPISPRLRLLKLEAPVTLEPGSLIFNERGEVVGMAHSFISGSIKNF